MVLSGWDRWLAIAVGGAIVLVYSTIGGMWSITLADQVQFVIKTVGVFLLMLPFAWKAVGGLSGIQFRVEPASSNGTGSARRPSSPTLPSTPWAC